MQPLLCIYLRNSFVAVSVISVCIYRSFIETHGWSTILGSQDIDVINSEHLSESI